MSARWAVWVFLAVWATFFFGGFIYIGLMSTGAIMDPLGRDFRLERAAIDIEVLPDGTMRVREEIGYLFKGCFHEAYRVIGISREPSADAPYVLEADAACDPACEAYDRGYEIAGDFTEICDRQATFSPRFSVAKGIVVGEDVAELHYKAWGEDWTKPLERIEGEIVLPEGVEPIAVYFNPRGTVEYAADGNIVRFTGGKVPDFLEVRLLLPKEAFARADVRSDPSLTLAKARSAQQRYAFKDRAANILAALLAAAAIILSLVIPAMIYRKHGREPEIAYRAVYEREPVKGLKPYVINSLCIRTGDTTSDAIPATLLDLIRRRHIVATERMAKTKGLFSREKKSLVLEFKGNPRDALSEPERLVHEFFKGFAKEGTLVWNDLLVELRSPARAVKYKELEAAFEKAVDASYDLSRYFDARGNRIFKWTAFGGLVAGAGIAFSSWGISRLHPRAWYLPVVGILLAALSLVGLFLRRRVFGRFTPEGYEVYRRSMNLKGFMTDMTLLKQHPPASVAIWDEYLVYATLFGVADKVLDEMKVIVPESKMRTSGLAAFSSAGTMRAFTSASATASSALSSSKGGGGHGAGGGFGGGGGGAR